jgi:uncharacterized protein (DUF2062 family)
VAQSFSSPAMISAASALPTLWPILATLLTGAVPLAIVSAAVSYACVRRILRRRATDLPGLRA